MGVSLSQISTVPQETDIAVSAVMPCFNEERTLGLCIDKAQRCFSLLGLVGEIVVADNGSSDRSAEIARRMGARVVHEPRRGYGAALTAGISAARGRIVVMADADDSYDWLSIGDFVGKVEEGFDLVIGNRFKGGIEPDAMPPLHRFVGNPALSMLARVMYGIPIGDFHCGMRAFSRAAFERLDVQTSGMEFATEMVVNAARAGLRITEIPVKLYPDKRDRPPHLRSFRDGWRHLRFILTYAPDYLYLIPGSLLLLLGVAGMGLLAAGPVDVGGLQLGIHFLALASLLTLLGANVVGFGVLAKLVNARRVPVAPRSALGTLCRHFSLERGLLVGLAMTATGFVIDLGIFLEWLARDRGPMQETAHLAFVASTLFLLGINVVFGSFLFNMSMQDDRKHDR